jgi:flavin-dependent dehydrogenase
LRFRRFNDKTSALKPRERLYMRDQGPDGPPSETSVLVIGGGPAGSLTATLLAREGVDVTLLERDRHPRYHVGESLVPSLIPILRFAGLGEKIESYGFVKKPGALFKVKHDVPPGYVEFGKAKSHPYSFQVVRSEFDQLLFTHAREEGARTHEECKVTEIELEGERPVAARWTLVGGREGRTACEYLVDASGLDGVMSLRYLRNRTFQEAFKNVALVQYWTGTGKLEGDREGAIFVEALLDGTGWSWVIPLHDGTTSVGIVIDSDTYKRVRREHGSLEETFRAELDQCPETTKLLGDGRAVGEVRSFQDYSYAAERFSGPGFRLVGDAAGFIDPFFSTGVHMACLSALSGAASIASVRRDEVSEDEALRYHEKLVRRSYLRLMMAVSGVYAQIRNQKDVVLGGVSPDNFQLAFDLLQPLVSGDIDFTLEKMPAHTVQRTMEYLGGAMMELHHVESGSIISKIIGRRISKMELEDIQPVNAIDGLYLRMERGRLGLQRVTPWESAFHGLGQGLLGAVWRLVGRLDPQRNRPSGSAPRS